MTCILGIETPDGVLMVADRRVCWGTAPVSDGQEKLVRMGLWVTSYSGPGSWGNILDAARAEIELADAARGVREAVAAAIQLCGWDSEKDGRASMLLGGPCGLWLYSTEGHCITRVEPGRAIGVGSGGDYGQGAAWLALRNGLSLEEALRVGVQAAIANDSGCGGEPQVMWVTAAAEDSPAQRLVYGLDGLAMAASGLAAIGKAIDGLPGPRWDWDVLRGVQRATISETE